MPPIKPSTRSFAGIGHGNVRSLRLADVRMPISEQVFLEFDVDIIDQDVPLVFGLEKHFKYGCSKNEYTKTFKHHPSGIKTPLKLNNEHLYLEWPASEVCFTRSELKQMHKNFSHPSTEALVNLLKMAQ